LRFPMKHQGQAMSDQMSILMGSLT
jgi:hypothetical protein